MNKQMKFNVTLLDNIYGDNIRSADMTWEELMQRVKDPPVYRQKGKDGIIAGHCEWEDAVATKTVEEKVPMFDGDGAPILNEYGNQKTEKVTKTVEMKRRNGEPIMRALKGSRKVIDRSLLFLDCDAIEDFDKWLDSIFDLCNWWGWAFALYSSFSATAKKPRYRVIIPLSKPVTPEQYKRIASAIMHDLDEEQCDWENHKEEWTAKRKMKSVLHPIVDELLVPMTSDGKICEKITALPFFLLVVFLRYRGWILHKKRN